MYIQEKQTNKRLLSINACKNSLITLFLHQWEFLIAHCHKMGVCVLPKFIYLNLNSSYDGIWRECLWEEIRVRLGHEGGLLNSFMKREVLSLSLSLVFFSVSLFPHSGRVTARRQPSRGLLPETKLPAP